MTIIDAARPGRLATALLIALVLLPMHASAWWNDDWAFRKRIDIDLSQAQLTTAQADVPVLVRLHTGNFAYFLDTQADGSDLRFIADDDLTPLDFEIEQYDGLAGVASIWVKLPRLDPATPQATFWMYYGNDSVSGSASSPAAWDLNQTAVYHFAERAGLPADATAFGHEMTRSSAGAGGSGIIGSGLALAVDQGFELPATPALALDPTRGDTWSLWIRPSSLADESLLFSRGTSRRDLSIGLAGLDVFLEQSTRTEAEDPQLQRLETGVTLVQNRWQHLAISFADDGTRLFLDGELAAEIDFIAPTLSGALRFGADGDRPGFAGDIDELRLANIARPEAWLYLQAQMQAQDALIVVPGEDESRDAAGGLGEYLGLLWALLGAVRLEGWIIIGLLVLMGILSADVMISKGSLLKKVERADDEFMDAFDAGKLDLVTDTADAGEAAATSPLASLHAVARREWRELRAAVGQQNRLPPESLEVIRSALDAETVEQSGRLTSRLVLITIAVSGGPFLGLLGTVVGVMITFASIAAAGDVNVNTIAPGVSAALTTTVIGLLVAIPSLFGYNSLTTRITKRTTAMEVFADRLVARLALKVAGIEGAGDEDLNRAA